MTGPYQNLPAHGIAFDTWAGIIKPAYDEDGYWDYYYLYLQNSTDFAEVQDDPTKTLYVCGEGRIASLSWFFVANADADSSVDCIAWGADPEIFDTTGCSAPNWI